MKQTNKNKIEETLFKLSICSPRTIYEYYPRTRDRSDVKVMRCKRCGVVFLSRTDHISGKHYERMKKKDYWSIAEKKQMDLDDKIRATRYKSVIFEKKWLDVGTGMGGIMNLLRGVSREVTGVEPQNDIRRDLRKKGFEVFAGIDEVKENNFDIVTMFHVLEHLDDPISFIQKVHRKIVKNGKLVIEVPHANDFLIKTLNLKSFKNFTFWSEHLILHTRQSLTLFLKKAGFKKVKVYGFQRYGLMNHVYWLVKGKPGGQIFWSKYNSKFIDKIYSYLLDKIDRTDTLVAIAEK